ncbi:MAG: serine/threonine protein kinase [Myxococcales bacterium]|nr:serine/threonine protein kinase [Myxococcales bacterium]
MLKPDLQIGRYRVLHALGRGKPDGLWAVVDTEGRHWAMRSPIADLEDSGSAITDRFLPDALALKSLVHMNLLPVFEVFVNQQGYLCMVMERLVGRNLRAAIDAEDLTPRATLIIARQILEGAAAAHAAGRVHQALQPSKVLLFPFPTWELAKVTEFGLGTLREEAVLEFGNDALTGAVRKVAAAYMAPEQVRGRSVDARTDLYAIGVMIFEMLVGRPPYLDSDPQNVQQQHVSAPIPSVDDLAPGSPWATPQIKALLNRSLAKEREERFQNAAQMIVALELAAASILHLQAG